MHPTYTPILKARWGELRALAEVDSAGRNTITPLIDVPPLPQADPDDAEEGDPAPRRNPFPTMAERLSGAWAQTGPVWIDTGALGPDDYEFGDPHGYFVREAADSGLRLVPVVRSNPRSAERISSLGFRNGVVARLRSADFAVQVSDVLARVASDTGVVAADTDILIDLGSVPADAGESTYFTARQMLLALPPRGWRSVTLAASTFPENLGMITGAGEARLPRGEWALWRRIRARSDWGFEVQFGDYGVSHPAFPAFGRTGPPSLRYTAGDVFLLVKRRRASETQPFPYRDLARYVVSTPEYQRYGPSFSWGDGELARLAAQLEKGKGGKGWGGAKEWRKIGTSHHLAVVVQDIFGG
ncbi:MAG TPA: hypothetical protein VF665_14260 [Longimicrobium sp.]|jgi:hypothetical protein|uniref:beta family protein n=1 Tax=Longimicrobium sp. TaxID=2029185 RepID=UPI002ED9FCAF